jgi:N-acyl-D-amino-acid deacylase
MKTSRTNYDLILRNGTVIDGSGRPRFKADVAIDRKRIVGIGDLRHVQADADLDVSGSVVSPGFIDVHTHDDAALIARPEMTAKLSQGVTTVIAGNCGISGAPYVGAGDPPDLLRLVFKSDQFVAPTFDGYFDKVRASAPALNSAFLTGHTTLRMQVMGHDLGRTATEAEIQHMRALLVQCLEQGSLGLSTGLFYPPARAAATREVIEVAQPLKDYRGVYTTHMRDEADGVMDSVRETLQIGRSIQAPVIISHHKCMGKNNFGRSAETLALLSDAAGQQPLSLDVYPYTAASTVLNKDMVERSSKTLIAWSDPYPEFCARDLDEVVQALGCARDEALQRLQPAGAIYFMMDEEDLRRIIQFPETMIGSDGLPEDKHPHPRLWGTFPRILGRYARDLGVLTLEDAVHRMTGLSARRFGFENRGRLEVGQYADVTVFDPDTVMDTATFEHPISPAQGILYVFVNGRMALEKGVPTDARAGTALRRMDLTDGHHS